MMNSDKNIIIVAGGSGGHVFPALSLYNHFLKKKMNPTIISDKRGIRFLGNLSNLKIEIKDKLNNVIYFLFKRSSQCQIVN